MIVAQADEAKSRKLRNRDIPFPPDVDSIPPSPGPTFPVRRVGSWGAATVPSTLENAVGEADVAGLCFKLSFE